MPSFRQLVAAHAPLLVLDAASARIQVGVIAAGGATRWAESREEAGTGIFRCLAALGAAPAACGAWVFCDGPGSVLGVRTVAMALRAWAVVAPRPVFGYCSLALVAHALGRPELTVIADARRESWHRFQVSGRLARGPAADLGTGPLAMPEDFRHWSEPPARVTRVPYSVAELLLNAGDADLFHATAAPDAFLHEEPSYVAWTPQIHRAPAARK